MLGVRRHFYKSAIDPFFTEPALNWDGSTTEIRTPTGVTEVRSNNFTLNVWVKNTITGTRAVWTSGSYNGDMFRIYIEGGYAKFLARNGGGDVITPAVSSMTVNDDNWYMLTARRTAPRTFELYVNGVYQATQGYVGSNSSIDVTNSTIGGASFEANLINMYQGQLKHAASWTSALTPTEILALYTTKTVDTNNVNLEVYYKLNHPEELEAPDFSGNGNDANIWGSTTYS